MKSLTSLFSKRALGIDISDSSIEMLELKETGRSVRVVAHRRVRLPDGIVRDGRIVNADMLASKLRETYALPGYGAFTTTSAVVALPESQSYLHVFRLPAVISEQQLGEAIRYEAEETLPLFLDQTEHDYRIIGRDEANQEVLYVACLKDVVSAYRQVVEKAGLTPTVMENESAALARSVAGNQSDDAILIADIGARATVLTVYDRHAIRFSENVSFGGQRMDEALSHGHAWPLKDAEAKRMASGFNAPDIATILDPLVAEVTESMRKVIASYAKRTNRHIQRIVCGGGSCLVPGLIGIISQRLGLPVAIGDPLSDIVHEENAFAGSSAVVYAVVFGLARRGLNDAALKDGVNLLGRSGSQRQVSRGVESDTRKLAPAKPLRTMSASGWYARNKRGVMLLGVFGLLLLVFVVLYLVKMTPLGG